MMNKYRSIGVLAHVDAGKTTLSEAILFQTGAIRSLGRVDHGDAFLDTDETERKRGITIYSKEARFSMGDTRYILVDTPGHVDFSPEMERTLQILDCAILVISAADGVTGQVRLLWKLLDHYQVPVFLFVNKMDQPGADGNALLSELQEKLSSHCLSFAGADVSDPDLQEAIALCDESLLEAYLEDGCAVTERDVKRLVSSRKLFPVVFGSALKLTGVDTLLATLQAFVPEKEYGEAFGARVFKITREGGKRYTHLRITGGCLKIRDVVPEPLAPEDAEPEKIDGIFLQNGAKPEAVQEVSAGNICAVTGLSYTRIGDGLGFEETSVSELIQPILNYRLLLTDDADPVKVWQNLQQLQEEDPLLQASNDEETGDLYVRVMGSVQMELLKSRMESRFGVTISFDTGRIVYKETIASTVEGVGHFEPLRHYAEVHLLLSPGDPGSGLVFDTDCSTDLLAKNWQRLVLTHLEEKRHKGVLTGSDLTDVKITLIGGKAHEKHTEGGDFRKATYRAVRQGLMMAESVLLEPVLSFRLEVPSENLGRAMTDLSERFAKLDPPDLQGNTGVLTGSVPAATLADYAGDVAAYTKGEGSLTTFFKDYEPCHNAEEVIAESGYLPDADLRNPASSVFCSHGAGTVIPWDQVRDYMHVDTGWRPGKGFTAAANNDAALEDLSIYDEEAAQRFRARQGLTGPDTRDFKQKEADLRATEKELQAIFERTYGPIKQRTREPYADSYDYSNIPEKESTEDLSADRISRQKKPAAPEKSYLLIDGYNVIFASKELKDLAERDIKAARDKLMDICVNFRGFRSETLILVFDAYKVEGGREHVEKYHNIHVVYTKEAETADQYIEKAAADKGKHGRVTVATSDAIEQVIVLGSGAYRLSASDFWDEVARTEKAIREHNEKKKPESLQNYVLKKDI